MKRIVRQYPQSSEPDKFYVTCLGIDMNQHLWLVRKMECEADAQGEATDVVTTFAREFRYDGDRQRYLIRDRNPNNLLLPVREYWRDYLGNDIHVDYEVGLGDPQDPNIVPGNRYTHGYGLFHVDTPSGEQYLHADMVGSTQLVTDGAGNVVDSAFYTAFGEVLAGDLDIRYGYCGSWGYQTDGFEDPNANVGLLHVGARYYSPEIGRFVQRDPIGFAGGLNVYAYAANLPTVLTDPTGLMSLNGLLGGGGAWALRLGPYSSMVALANAQRIIQQLERAMVIGQRAVYEWGLRNGFGPLTPARAAALLDDADDVFRALCYKLN